MKQIVGQSYFREKGDFITLNRPSTAATIAGLLVWKVEPIRANDRAVTNIRWRLNSAWMGDNGDVQTKPGVADIIPAPVLSEGVSLG